MSPETTFVEDDEELRPVGDNLDRACPVPRSEISGAVDGTPDPLNVVTPFGAMTLVPWREPGEVAH